jgi:hypothetical protein
LTSSGSSCWIRNGCFLHFQQIHRSMLGIFLMQGTVPVRSHFQQDVINACSGAVQRIFSVLPDDYDDSPMEGQFPRQEIKAMANRIISVFRRELMKKYNGDESQTAGLCRRNHGTQIYVGQNELNQANFALHKVFNRNQPQPKSYCAADKDLSTASSETSELINSTHNNSAFFIGQSRIRRISTLSKANERYAAAHRQLSVRRKDISTSDANNTRRHAKIRFVREKGSQPEPY